MNIPTTTENLLGQRRQKNRKARREKVSLITFVAGKTILILWCGNLPRETKLWGMKYAKWDKRKLLITLEFVGLVAANFAPSPALSHDSARWWSNFFSSFQLRNDFINSIVKRPEIECKLKRARLKFGVIIYAKLWRKFERVTIKWSSMSKWKESIWIM